MPCFPWKERCNKSRRTTGYGLEPHREEWGREPVVKVHKVWLSQTRKNRDESVNFHVLGIKCETDGKGVALRKGKESR